MIDIMVSTPDGLVLSKNDVTYILAHSNEHGEFAVLENHIAIVSTLSPGYIKVSSKSEKDLYIALNSALFEFSDNNARVIANQAFLAKTKEAAEQGLKEKRDEMLKKNKQSEQKFVAQEKQLKDSIRKMHSGNL